MLRSLLLKSATASCSPASTSSTTTTVLAAALPRPSPQLSTKRLASSLSPSHFTTNRPTLARSLASTRSLPATLYFSTAPSPFFSPTSRSASSSRAFSTSLPGLRPSLPARLPFRVPFFSTSKAYSTAALPIAPEAAETFAPPPNQPVLTTPHVAKYLLVIAGMVFTIVVVGGMTRLTESGLSITEWNVVSGVIPPISQQDWEVEFDKYKRTPEWRLQNQHITMSEFKTIFFWEWSHRMLGRAIGLAFLAPIPYFYLRRRLSPSSSLRLLAIGTGIGAQGALGWYMVKSGLDQGSVDDLGGVARVSQYRLAAHLGMAFLVYAGCFRMALGVARDYKLVNGGKGGEVGLGGVKGLEATLRSLENKTTARVRVAVTAVTALIFVTALSGAFVAGLDAGLVYNEFPLMGGRLQPPKSELMDDRYSRKADRSDRWWRNLFENPTTVQFDHRVLATTTFTSIVALFLYVRRPSIKPHLPPTTYRLIKGTMHMSFLQVALGISTLLYLVPIHLAATHQAGSLVLLTLALASGASLRRPGKVVREILRMRRERGLSGLGLAAK